MRSCRTPWPPAQRAKRCGSTGRSNQQVQGRESRAGRGRTEVYNVVEADVKRCLARSSAEQVIVAEPAAGIPSFIGYEYQILATVWVGLDLVIRRQCCDHIIVEPASEEDVAAHLRVNDERASATLLSTSPDGYPVEIQIKLRRSGHWTRTPFVGVLNGEAGEAGRGGQSGGTARSRIWSTCCCFGTRCSPTLASITNWTLAKNLPRIYPTNSPKARRVAGRGSFRHRHVKTCCGHVPRYQTIPAQGKSFPRLRSVGSSLRRKAPSP